ncbi:DUF2442 domain-containing protein [Ectothiorhodospiraceae bacterium BW-2]|nr:DUF2442 domain-containing protein [Ectothiorhodospiraceae bacterium BW-2]
MTPDVTQVHVIDNTKIEALFADGERRLFDLSRYFDYPAFRPLQNPDIFQQVHVEHGVVVWNDDIDLSPDTLYLRGKRI